VGGWRGEGWGWDRAWIRRKTLTVAMKETPAMPVMPITIPPCKNGQNWSKQRGGRGTPRAAVGRAGARCADGGGGGGARAARGRRRLAVAGVWRTCTARHGVHLFLGF